MKTKFGILARLTSLQDIVSSMIAKTNPMIINTIEKYLAISKVFLYSANENISGDYLEFGVYSGTSFCHAIKSCKKSMMYMYDADVKTRFFGFDSFEGFGTLDKRDEHPFFKDENFATDFTAVKKRVKYAAKGQETTLVKGFFSDTLKDGPAQYGIKKAKVIMVDCDVYSAAKEVFKFCSPLLQEGSVIILDDELCYKGNQNKGEYLAFREFVSESNTEIRKWFTYGATAGVYIVTAMGGKGGIY